MPLINVTPASIPTIMDDNEFALFNLWISTPSEREMSNYYAPDYVLWTQKAPLFMECVPSEDDFGYPADRPTLNLEWRNGAWRTNDGTVYYIYITN